MKENREITTDGIRGTTFRGGRAARWVYLCLMRNFADATSESAKVPQPVALLLWDILEPGRYPEMDT